ncbi:MAG: Na-translocating system protein MpsC family protein [Gemmatimonadales bacterium]
MAEEPRARPPAARIATSAVQLLHEYTGRGPTKARATINGDLVTVLFADTLTAGERKLVEGGHSERVLEVRHAFQTVMQDDLVAIVETELDRQVIAFMSQNHVDPDLAIEVFVLEPDDAEPQHTSS